uniref:Uncharacterized protein n=1 Tax=Solanum lycopersicum TaxID=4081 RepID=A0A3Q7GNV3_SOLLC
MLFFIVAFGHWRYSLSLLRYFHCK